ncbi:MAG: ABC transporter substrate-binding protein [Bacteroidales bacterium]|nr:ABC transporter substrate-binding protein [Bacteroidales bacterium]
MKKLFAFVAAAMMVCACGGDRSTLLKVYNWSDYIDESVIPEFEQWYEEQTGEKVHVIYQTFDVNETMLSKIEKGHEDFDVVCPSDYIIERMLASDLLLPIDRDFGDTPNYIDSNLSPYIRACFDKMEGGDKNANDYAVGYMWGTTGILYNAKYVTDEEASTWEIIRNPKFADRIFIKDSARDVFSQIILLLRQKQIQAGEVTLDELMHDSSEQSMLDVENYMKQVKELVAGWEADFGKEQMTQERGWINLTWSGDAVWAIEEAAEMGVDLRYSLPKEGFTVWFDGWVIPKYAVNTKAAKYWIDFMSRPDIVIRNVDVTGYVSVSGAPEVLEAFTDEECEPLDLSYFFGPDATSVCADPVLYPDRADIERSTQEHDWGDKTPELVAMWSRVKGENANATTVIVIAVVLAAAVVFAVYKRVTSRNHGRRSANKRTKTAKK